MSACNDSSRRLFRFGVVGLVVCLLLVVKSEADPYGSPAAPPPKKVDGKTFPQSVFCNDPTSKCFGKHIKCPKQCPTLKPADSEEGQSNSRVKACFVDCKCNKCESICKTRKPNCNGIGSACYDPRFIGGDGVMFYFHGKKNETFALVSDTNIQINARFIGRRPQGRSRDNTWIQALGLMFGPHTFTLSAKKVAQWDPETDQLHLTYDGISKLPLLSGHLSSWTAPDSSLFIERTAKHNSVTVTIPEIVEVSVNVVPVTKQDDLIHKYQIPSDDCFAHLEVQFKFLGLSEEVEGVLGQTYRSGFTSPVKRGVPMPIMGGEDKYKTTSLLASDCKLCGFSSVSLGSVARGLVIRDADVTVKCGGGGNLGSGVVCRR